MPRSLAGKPLAGFCTTLSETYSSLIRRSSILLIRFLEPIITSIIDVQKTVTWGESGFPATFLGGVVKSAVIPARVGIRINLGPNTTLLVRILDSRPRLRGGDVPSRE